MKDTQEIIDGMPASDYHAHEAVSKSLLDQMARTPHHARAYLDGARTEPTKAMEFGTALHSAVLEPAVFANNYQLFDGDRRIKAGKAEYDDLIRIGKTPISSADYNIIQAMQHSVANHPLACKLLSYGEAEQSVFWNHNVGVQLKCRPDWWIREVGIVVDLKTTEDASPAGFARSVAKYRYHVQAAHYMDGCRAEQFLFIAVEKKAPYAVAVYELDKEALAEGRRLRDRDVLRYQSCAEFGVWPGYSDEATILSLPSYAIQGDDE